MKLTIADKDIKTGRSTAFAVLIGLCVTLPAAQAPAAEQVRLNVRANTVPTTQILAIGRSPPISRNTAKNFKKCGTIRSKWSSPIHFELRPRFRPKSIRN